MTLSEVDRKWREERLAPATPCKPKRGSRVRFAPLNALADGGWLGALTPGELRVWVAIYRLADSASRARASHGTIARLAGMRRENAARTTAALEKRGLLRVVVRGRKVGRVGKRTSNVYELLVPEPLPNSVGGDTIEEPE